MEAPRDSSRPLLILLALPLNRLRSSIDGTAFSSPLACASPSPSRAPPQDGSSLSPAPLLPPPPPLPPAKPPPGASSPSHAQPPDASASTREASAGRILPFARAAPHAPSCPAPTPHPHPPPAPPPLPFVRETVLKKWPEEFVREFRNKELDFLRMRTRLKVRKLPPAESLGSKLLFAIRIPGTTDLHPHIRKILKKLRLTRVLTGVFLKATEPTLKRLLVVEPFVTYGFPNLKNVKELIYKKGRGFLDKEPFPLTSNDLIEKYRLGQLKEKCCRVEDTIIGASKEYRLGQLKEKCCGLEDTIIGASKGIVCGPSIVLLTCIQGDLKLTMDFPHLYSPGFRLEDVNVSSGQTPWIEQGSASIQGKGWILGWSREWMLCWSRG